MKTAIENSAPRSLSELPDGVDLVWHGANDIVNLRQFLASEVPWAELDVNTDPTEASLILRHDTFDERPCASGEQLLPLAHALAAIAAAQRAVKIDFKVGGRWIPRVLEQLDMHGFPHSRVWLNGEWPLLGDKWLQYFAEQYPAAVIQVPVHFLGDYAPRLEAARAQFIQAAELGVNRFSVPWRHPRVHELLDLLRAWNLPFNLYGMRDLASFLAAVQEQPASVTADFNFPEWGYFGRGSGHNGVYWRYQLAGVDGS